MFFPNMCGRDKFMCGRYVWQDLPTANLPLSSPPPHILPHEYQNGICRSVPGCTLETGRIFATNLKYKSVPLLLRHGR